jgi:hypothetical protein
MRERENQHEANYLAIKILLYVIIYPHARELFAFRKDRRVLQNKMNLC